MKHRITAWLRGVAGLALGVLTLAGCSSTPLVFSANWYLQPAEQTNQSPRMKLAIVNRGTQPATLASLHVNGNGEAGTDGGWAPGTGTCRWQAPLLPGALLLLDLGSFQARSGEPWPASCLVPVRLVLQTAETPTAPWWAPWHAPQAPRIDLQLANPLPNALPEEWLQCPVARPQAPAAPAPCH